MSHPAECIVNIRFMLTSSEEGQFLDTRVYICGNALGTDSYEKTTDRNNVLHYQSNHPKKMVGSQLLRVRRIVSEE